MSSCRKEIQNYPTKNAMKDAQREKYTACVERTYKGICHDNLIMMIIKLLCITDSHYLKMEYHIRPSTLIQDISIKDSVCQKTFMAAWGISKNAMNVLKDIYTFLFIFMMPL